MVQTTMKLATSTQALEELMIGNERFALSEAVHPHQSTARRAELRRGQSPFALILTCADSQLSPSIIFDQGLGDLYVVRVGGNVVDEVVLGSIELAVQKFDIPLIVVLGHGQCLAIETALDGQQNGHFAGLAAALQPAIDQVKGEAGDSRDDVAQVNAQMMAERLRSAEPVLAGRFASGQLKIVAAFYDGASGEVEILA